MPQSTSPSRSTHFRTAGSTALLVGLAALTGCSGDNAGASTTVASGGISAAGADATALGSSASVAGAGSSLAGSAASGGAPSVTPAGGVAGTAGASRDAAAGTSAAAGGGAGGGGGGPDDGGKGPKSVLFVGNSFTFYNEMPYMFAKIAETAGRSVSVDAYTPGGQSNCSMWDDSSMHAELLTKINERAWDYVVLQPWDNPAEDFKACGVKWLDAIASHRAQTKVLVYMTSGEIDPDDGYMAVQQATFLEIIMARAESTLVPTMWAWRKAYREHPDAGANGAWLAEDAWHPGPRRSYMSAVSIYATLFRVTPIGLTNSTEGYPGDVKLSPEDAAYLQELVWQAVGSYTTDASLRH